MMRLFSLRFITIDRMGIVFGYKGDEVVLMWSGLWQGRMWLSIESEGRYSSLKALDEWWDEYFRAERGEE